MGIQELAQVYESKSDEELLRIALEPQQLTPEARAALNGELAKRGITPERMDAFRRQEQERKAEADKNPGTLFLLHPYGIGRQRFGKAEYRYTPETRMEHFKTTVFVVLFWVPLIPTATYLVERKREFLTGEMTVLERVPLDWEQVLKVWVAAASIALALIWTLKLLTRLLLKS